MGMGSAQAFVAAAATTAALYGYCATFLLYVRWWKGEIRHPQSVKEERDAFRRRIRSKNWTGFRVALVLAVFGALIVLFIFAPLAAMFVFPRGSTLGEFLGGVSAFGVLLGVRHLSAWVQERLM